MDIKEIEYAIKYFKQEKVHKGWKAAIKYHDLAIKALEEQISFENQVSNISDWFVDYKDELLEVAWKTARDALKQTENVASIDEEDLDFIVEEIMNEVQKSILNVLSTYIN